MSPMSEVTCAEPYTSPMLEGTCAVQQQQELPPTQRQSPKESFTSSSSSLRDFQLAYATTKSTNKDGLEDFRTVYNHSLPSLSSESSSRKTAITKMTTPKNLINKNSSSGSNRRRISSIAEFTLDSFSTTAKEKRKSTSSSGEGDGPSCSRFRFISHNNRSRNSVNWKKKQQQLHRSTNTLNHDSHTFLWIYHYNDKSDFYNCFSFNSLDRKHGIHY
jgi:hypothetical protein